MTGKLIGTRLPAKITGMLIALVMATCFMAYYGNVFKVSAVTTIMRGDVDGDGNVMPTDDLQYIYKFLEGKTNFPPDRCDVNQDGIVDVEDAHYLAKHIVGYPIEGWTTNYTVNSTTSSNVGTKEFVGHDVSGNQDDFFYDITVNAPPDPTGIYPLNIIDMDDNRQPYTGDYADAVVEVGEIELFGTNVLFDAIATGFIIGSNKVVTNSHIIYGTTWKGDAIRTNDGAIYRIDYMHMPRERYDGTKYNSDDYALLKIGENAETEETVDLAETYGWLDAGVITNDRILQSDSLLDNSTPFNNIAVIGFPRDVNGSQVNYYFPLSNNEYYDWGTLFQYSTTLPSTLLQYTNSTSGGNSGSPIIFDKDGNHSTTDDWVVSGIHVNHEDGEYSQGVRFTARHLKFFFNNTHFITNN
jgi:V8-like Glu-specific endopeptidase